MLEDIRCTVLKSLPDIIIVSYETPDKRTFQGALLNVSNPFPLEEIQEKIGELNSKDFSPICKRHTYFQLKKSDPYEKGIAAKKLGVRLRARQVLCNNCKSSCTETGETVQPKRSSEKENQHERLERRSRSRSTYNLPSTSMEQRPVIEHRNSTLVPRVYRLTQHEIDKYLSPSGYSRDDQQSNKRVQRKKQPLKIKFTNSGKLKKSDEPEGFSFQDSNDGEELNYPPQPQESRDVSYRSASPATRTRSMRRKRSAPESVYDFSEDDEGSSITTESGATELTEGKNESSPPRTTPVLKISFGHGSVMKIKAKLNGPSEQDISENYDDYPSSYVQTGNSPNSHLWQSKSPRYSSYENIATAKAARKALKKARKEAQRRGLQSYTSPTHAGSPSKSGTPSGILEKFYTNQPSSLSHSPSSVFDQGSQISDTVSQNPIVLTEETPIDDSTRKKHKKKKHKKRKFDNDHLLPSSEAFSEQSLTSLDHKDVIPGSVVWGQTSNSIWWPAKVTSILDPSRDDGEVQVSWYSNLVENTSNAKLSVTQIRSFHEYFERYHEQSLNDPAFLTAVWLAKEDTKIEDPLKTTLKEFSENALVLSP